MEACHILDDTHQSVDYEALIRQKDAELKQLFSVSETLLETEYTIDEPLNEEVRTQFEMLQSKEKTLYKALNTLQTIYDKLKDYDQILSQREAFIKNEIGTIRNMEERLNMSKGLTFSDPLKLN